MDTQYKNSDAFLTAVWGGKTATTFISVKHLDGKFENVAVDSVAEAIQIAQKFVADSCDVYFSCATFKDHSSREADNAEAAFAHWLDLDCDEEKAAASKGYATKSDAKAALDEFCRATGLPVPNIIVDSGNGLHVYWLSHEAIPTETWKAQAAKLKALTHHYGLLADDSRTADMASVLRVPGTFNFKNLAAPKIVKLRRFVVTGVNHAE